MHDVFMAVLKNKRVVRLYCAVPEYFSAVCCFVCMAENPSWVQHGKHVLELDFIIIPDVEPG